MYMIWHNNILVHNNTIMVQSNVINMLLYNNS